MSLYYSTDDLISRLEIGSTITGDQLAWAGEACVAATAAVDDYCHRAFTLSPTATMRRFSVDGGLLLVDDIGSLDGLVVSYGSQTRLLDADFEVHPINALDRGRPVTRLVPLWRWTGRVAVTARWGWPTVPPQVRTAAGIKAHQLYKRREAWNGIAGMDGYGPVRLSKFEDPTVCQLLDPLVRHPVLAA